MRIDHAAIWVKDIERMKSFYEMFFNVKTNEKYQNKDKKFESYFLTFGEGARLEIMCKTGIDEVQQENRIGWAHIAIALGTREAVDNMTARLHGEGFRLVSGPRVTGDGYYESVIEDPEGNLLELTV